MSKSKPEIDEVPETQYIEFRKIDNPNKECGAYKKQLVFCVKLRKP